MRPDRQRPYPPDYLWVQSPDVVVEPSEQRDNGLVPVVKVTDVETGSDGSWPWRFGFIGVGMPMGA